MKGVDFGQLVIGPPGSGKTTYCEGLHQLLSALNRPHLRINLDFANDWTLKENYRQTQPADVAASLPALSPPDVDVRELITVEQVMREQKLGPNGALLYCNRFIADKSVWLKQRIVETKREKGLAHAYLLVDMPGQVELYAHDDAIIRLIGSLGKSLRLAAVHLVDSTLCVQPHQYLSALLVALTAQLTLEMPFVNVLSKVDLVQREGRFLEFPLEFFARAEDLNLLLPVAHPAVRKTKDAKFVERERKFAQFHEAICEAVEDFSMVSFVPLAIEDKEMCLNVLAAVDQANGYALSAYLPPSLRIPGLESQDETRLPVDPTMRYHGSKWFDRIPDTIADDYAD
eukprot:Protomagalhaensia_sp_Gyna_25__3170@NODE_289_length_4038_cov_191_170293_g223_i0_p2_GENE_NODE_289_length_4038_cov_191_170293_g223_i0NODE_289_length_4038_cov_191_170293_g223_i0_p2_ORF_typecomplete_len343_score40_35ATP_bind_1/PF03029_17/4_7e70AAA_33/PF13671_6/0_00029Mg_chelatase/PF01078_21/0_0009AAA_18/PF13238_6/0_0013PRK/PF00485_18/0_0013AAA_28/PF13521_6/0_0035AAA_5/PF07728_14/0_0035AP_endonuc_2/PF01261_24/0_2AP_endonuc_2/PF01261_24/3_7e03AP_endonuc_2/PF01261_24/1_1e02AAA_17/PF13207_6/0_012FeoB_N/P